MNDIENEFLKSISKANLEFGRSVHVIGKAVPMDRERTPERSALAGAVILAPAFWSAAALRRFGWGVSVNPVTAQIILWPVHA
jgi:hypothetical protein